MHGSLSLNQLTLSFSAQYSYEPVTLPKLLHPKRDAGDDKVQSAEESYLNWRRTK
jgi:hypothetical protein